MSLAAEPRASVTPIPPDSDPAVESRDTIAVIGGGAAGVLAAFSLAREGLRPVVIADGRTPGHGIAYATSDPLHRLNVPAARMSVCPDDQNSFVRWIQANVDRRAQGSDFVPRSWYGDYLAGVLGDLVSTGKAALWAGRAVSVAGADPAGRGERVHVSLADGRQLDASAAVFAVGCPPPVANWAPPALATDSRLVVDPWAPGKLTEIAGPPSRPREVLLVGAGLTMVDVALSVASRNPRARITAVSRSGLLPMAHLPVPSSPIPTPEAPQGPLSLETAREIVADSIGLAVRLTGDWRPGIDGLRPITQALWKALPAADRARFLREDRRRWDVLRHRMAPQVAEAITQLRQDGRLRVDALGDRTIGDYPWQRFDTVVACTGQGGQLSADPLLAGMIAAGSIRSDPLGLGLDCDGHGRPFSRDGRVWRQVSVIGALRRGQLWESTAIPELRAQASHIATRLSLRKGTQPLGR